MQDWWSKLSLKYKLQIPIQLLLLVIMVLAQRVILDRFEERVLEESRQNAFVVADGVINGLNMLMINGIISDAEQRSLYMRKMSVSEKVLELRIIRSKQVEEQFGKGLASEQALDEMDRLTMTSAQAQSKLHDQAGAESLRIVEPFVAKRDFRGTNCLNCHAVPEDTVLGAVSVTMNVADEFEVIRKVNAAFWGALVIAQMFLYFVIGWLIGLVTRPLREAVILADAVSKGDLTRYVEVKSGDETGRLMQAMQDMNESLSVIVKGVRGATDKINIASHEIAQGNTDLSQRTEEQASSLAEIASNMGELASTVKQNAENAKQANNLAQGTVGIAEQSGGSVKELVATMTAISESSKKIENIIGVIDGIAFQTNILALNAAVEAARAGDQGRGFAVVAGEVRNLAQRSATAAKEIKSLIGDSVDKVNIGSKQVSDAAEGISDVVTSVQLVSSLMKDNAAAIAEQSAGIAQVSQAITQMDEVTQQNAALVDEAAAAAESMRDQANGLFKAVSVFKLVEGKEGMTAKPAFAPSAKTALTAVSKGRRLNKVRNDGEKRLSGHPKDGEWKEF